MSASSPEAARLEPVPSQADSREAAFFDLDNTMMMGASIFYFARGLAARDFFTSVDVIRFGWRHVAYRSRRGEDADEVDETRTFALSFVTGKDEADIRRYGEEIYDERMARRICSGTHALARRHLLAGRQVWLVTAAPVELASVVARRLGLTGAIATVAEVVDGRYTGRLVGEPMHGPAKAAAIRGLADRERLDLSRCWAYSDSINDLPMLSLVGHAVAVNPDHRLTATARQRGWPVEDYRPVRRSADAVASAAAGLRAHAGAATAGVARLGRQTRPRHGMSRAVRAASLDG